MKKNVITEKQIFNDLKNKFKRGSGLSKPQINTTYNIDLNQKENHEAVDVGKKRTMRISTYIHDEFGDLLDKIILQIKRNEKKKPKIAEVLERAIKKLHDDLE